ncbi:MAG TPA: DsbA family protein [Thermoanaerobaculia bacterium]|nr:DsbA family protein [Thermoanaerobaculia bacterium]
MSHPLTTPDPSPSGRSRVGKILLVAAAAVLAVLALVRVQGGVAIAAQADDETVAKVDGAAISMSAVTDRAAPQLEQVETQRLQCEAQADKSRHDVLANTVEVLVREKLVEMAADGDQPPSEWLAVERTRRAEAVSAEEVGDWFNQNQSRLRRGTTLAQVEPQIRELLAQESLYDELKAKFEVDYMLDPYRVEVAEAAGRPAKGPADARVTLVEYSDFECPYCRQVVPTIQHVIAKYGDKVRVEYRQFPLTSIHANAMGAAHASLCANEQGKFWEMHDLMFEEQKELSMPQLKEKAGRLGLDQAAFDACVDSNKYAEAIQEDLRSGSLAGVTGTPAMFINGRPLSGAVDAATVSEVIDEELERGS